MVPPCGWGVMYDPGSEGTENPGPLSVSANGHVVVLSMAKLHNMFTLYTCCLCLFYVVFLCAMPQVIFNGVHANSISCLNVTYLFSFFAHSVSDL